MLLVVMVAWWLPIFEDFDPTYCVTSPPSSCDPTLKFQYSLSGVTGRQNILGCIPGGKLREL